MYNTYCSLTAKVLRAGVMQLADMIDLESIATSVQVQVLSPAPNRNVSFDILSRLFSFSKSYIISIEVELWNI